MPGLRLGHLWRYGLIFLTIAPTLVLGRSLLPTHSSIEVRAAAVFPLEETTVRSGRWRRGFGVGVGLSIPVRGALHIRARAEVASLTTDSTWAINFYDPPGVTASGGDRTLSGGYLEALGKLDRIRVFGGIGRLRDSQGEFFVTTDRVNRFVGVTNWAWSVHGGLGLNLGRTVAIEFALHRIDVGGSIFTYTPLSAVMMF
ncbi:MAG: hypothetical protein QGH20_00600 [Candidatus Latescibacteria bacterium]|nr:hypothetical protein [Candidatus Latescibacterota bacterium]